MHTQNLKADTPIRSSSFTLHHLIIFPVDIEDLLHTLLTFLVERVGIGPVDATGSTEPAAAKVQDVHQVPDHPTTETPVWGRGVRVAWKGNAGDRDSSEPVWPSGKELCW